MSEKRAAFRPAEILLPGAGTAPETWACLACDQYTSQPEYWEKTEEIVGEHPSTLRMMLPECWLGESDSRIPAIHGAMADYLRRGILTPAVRNGFVLCRRRTASGTRLGLVGTVDLEPGPAEDPARRAPGADPYPDPDRRSGADGAGAPG